MRDLIEKLRETKCNREPFTAEHADCICRLTNAAADNLEVLISAVTRAGMEIHENPANGRISVL